MSRSKAKECEWLCGGRENVYNMQKVSLRFFEKSLSFIIRSWSAKVFPGVQRIYRGKEHPPLDYDSANLLSVYPGADVDD